MSPDDILILTIFRWLLECILLSKVGLAAGRYSGTNLPDLYLTPHALHNVFGPMGPILHCGVVSVPQCPHLLFEGRRAFTFEDQTRPVLLLLCFFLNGPFSSCKTPHKSSVKPRLLGFVSISCSGVVGKSNGEEVS